MSRFCTDCGSPLASDVRFCVSCGTPVERDPDPVADTYRPDPTIPEAPVAAPAGKSRRSALVGVAALALVAGVGAYWFMTSRQATTLAPSDAAPIAQESSPSTNPTTDPESSESPTADESPAGALTLTRAAAIAELEFESDAASVELEDARGLWVSQVSTKCVGMNTDGLDLGTRRRGSWDFIPDGEPDDVTITPQLMAAFHRSMASEFGAVTARYRDLGNYESIPACSDPDSIYVSFIPKTHATKAAANRQCDALRIPPRDCYAVRYPYGGKGDVERETRD